jgi:hypothetical protein
MVAGRLFVKTRAMIVQVKIPSTKLCSILITSDYSGC